MTKTRFASQRNHSISILFVFLCVSVQLKLNNKRTRNVIQWALLRSNRLTVNKKNFWNSKTINSLIMLHRLKHSILSRVYVTFQFYFECDFFFWEDFFIHSVNVARSTDKLLERAIDAIDHSCE